MKIAVIGTGYVGLTTGTCLAELKNEVICTDIDQKKIENLKKGIIPIYEPGLENLVKKNLQAGRLHFSTNSKKAIEFADIVFSAVGTPPGKNHTADLKYVEEVAKIFGQTINCYKLFINKSTVPVGTTHFCKEIIQKELDKRNSKIKFDLVSNPEFLREGTAINDTFHPDRIIIGLENPHAKKIIANLYKPFSKQKTPILYTDFKSAEIIKYASNAFLATKISFINEIYNFTQLSGGQIKDIANGMGYDQRIGRQFLNAGIGYGGSCFPKDVKALIQTGKEFGYDFKIIRATEEVNEKQKISLFHKLKKLIPNLKNKHIAILGLAFKAETDDMREAPSIKVINALLKEGAYIKAYDPAAMENAKKIFSEPGSKKITYYKTSEQALKNADAALILTTWPQFKKIKATDFPKILLRGMA